MKTIVTITIENPSEETLKSLLEGSANKQTAIIKTQIKQAKSNTNTLKGKKPATKQKKCPYCLHDFEPHSNRQVGCDDCNTIRKYGKSTVMQSKEDTLAEIESRKNNPYVFGK
jgi:hypothetical protein